VRECTFIRILIKRLRVRDSTSTHARNIAAAVLFLLKNGSIGEKYNITGESEVSNLELAQFIAKTLGKELKYEVETLGSDVSILGGLRPDV